MELPMATLHANLKLSIRFDQGDQIFDFHADILTWPQWRGLTYQLGLPMLEKLRDGEANVLCDLAQQRRREITARVKWNSGGTSGTITKLPMGSTLPHLDKSQSMQDGYNFSGFQYWDVSHVLRNRDVLHPDKL
jgi:hypothetical protein